MDISWADSITPPLDEQQMLEHLKKFLSILGYADRHVSLYLTNDEEIRGLNQQYRNKDKPTDVLSWSYWEEDPESPVLGELAVSVDRIHEQAQTNGWDDAVEFTRLLAHGCAHLVGYDHEISGAEEQRMLTVEIEMLDAVGLSHIYR